MYIQLNFGYLKKKIQNKKTNKTKHLKVKNTSFLKQKQKLETRNNDNGN